MKAILEEVRAVAGLAPLHEGEMANALKYVRQAEKLLKAHKGLKVEKPNKGGVDWEVVFTGDFDEQGALKIGKAILKKLGVKDLNDYGTRRSRDSISYEFDLDGVEEAGVTYDDGGDYGYPYASLFFTYL